MPSGGRREPDGRQAQAKGIGKTAKRHDLEEPRTVPRLSGSDLQSGDVQRLEAAQQVAPIPQRAPSQTSTGTTGPVQQQNRAELEVPDAIDFAGERAGENIGALGQGSEPLDMSQWLPFLRALASNPKRSGPLATALLQQLSNANNTPGAGRVRVVDENAIQAAIERSYS
jgi:hypothetical protein